jgi:hypothetical protein
LDEESEKLINPDVSVWDILTAMWTTPSLFKFLTNFILGKFEKSAQLLVLTNVGRFSQVAWKLARFSSWKLQVLKSYENQIMNLTSGSQNHNLVITTSKTFKVLKNKIKS